MINKDKTAYLSLRLPKETYAKLKQTAERNMCSVNNQILFIINQYLQDHPIESFGSDPE